LGNREEKGGEGRAIGDVKVNPVEEWRKLLEVGNTLTGRGQAVSTSGGMTTERRVTQGA